MLILYFIRGRWEHKSPSNLGSSESCGSPERQMREVQEGFFNASLEDCVFSCLRFMFDL